MMLPDRLVGELHVLLRQPRLQHLLLHQKLFRDFHFFRFGVAVQAQHFHAVLQGGRNGVHHVRGGDEEDLRQVVLHVEVMVDEHEVLLGIEHFEQRRRGIAAEVHRHLVDFVEHEDRVLGAGLLHHLDDLAGQGADVGAAMAADFRLIAHAAERHAHELAAGRFGDRHAQRSLAHARRSDEAQNRALGILHQLADGEKFKDAFLDFLQAIMIFVQDFFGARDVADFLRPLLPRHGQQPVEIIARDRRFRRHGRHRFQLFQFLDRLVAHILRHARGFDLLLQFVEFALFAAPQFFLDGLDFFVEVVLFLRLLHLPLDPRLDGAVHVELFDFHVEHVADAVQTLGGIEDFEQRLLFFDGELQVGGDGVGQLRRIFHAHGGDHGFVVQRLAELYILLEHAGDALHARFNLRRRLGGVTRDSHGGLADSLRFRDLQDLAALDAFHQHFDISVGQFQALHDVDDGPHLENVAGLGFVDAGVVLGGKKNFLIAGQSFFESAHARLPAHYERSHHIGKDDHVPNGHHGQLLALELFLGVRQRSLPSLVFV